MVALQLEPERRPVPIALRWAARVTSVGSVGLLGCFFFGEMGSPTPGEWVALAFFPGGLVVGQLLGWWRELLGGVVGLVSLGLFYLWFGVGAGGFPTGPYFALFAVPAVLFVAAGLARRMGG
jgi:hypothetical protein